MNANDLSTQTQQSEPRPAGSRKRWLRRAWLLWGVLGLAWLGAGSWLSRPAPSWHRGWVGWWTGDRMAARPLWNLQGSLLEGAEVVSKEGNRAYRLSNCAVDLGLWRDKSQSWSWAGWILVERLPEAEKAVPLQLVSLRAVPDFDWRLWRREDLWLATLDTLSASRIEEHRLHLELSAPGGAGDGWVHLAFIADRGLHKLFVNGELAGQEVIRTPVSPQLASLGLSGAVPAEYGALTVKPVVWHDDIVVWDRALGPEEVSALASAGRDAWGRTVDRRAFAEKWRTWGRGLGGTTFALLAAWSVARWLALRVRLFAEALPLPSFRPIMLVALAGTAVSLGLAATVKISGRRADEARFAELLQRLRSDADNYWEKQAGLAMRARDWLATQSEPSPAAWAAWLRANHFPHDYAGIVGIGYAEQVLPADLDEHEARWSARHGSAYRVHPPRDPQGARPIRELAGDPQLPVVLYAPVGLGPERWMTNSSILGRDLLYVPWEDRRGWSESIRVEQAAARNEVTSSDLEEIAPAEWYGRRIEGLRLYVPWTLRDKADDGQALEPEAWRGVWFVSADFRSVVAETLAEGRPLVGYRLHTGTMGGQRHAQVLDTGELDPAAADRPAAYLRGTIEIPLYHSRLYLDLWTTPAFEAQSTRWRPWWIAGSGLGITALVAALLFVQVRAREAQQSVLDALREANARLLAAYRDREHLSRDLHDGSIQNLYALGLHLQRVDQLLATKSARAREELRESLGLLDHSIAELRQFILSAGVESLDRQTTASALEGLVHRLRGATDIDVRLQVDPTAERLSPGVGVQVLQVVREAVSNALRHSGAHTVTIALTPSRDPQAPNGSVAAARNGWWQLAISDDGRGFEPTRAECAGNGLENIAARARDLGGASRLESSPGAGTTVVVDFPETN